MKRRINFMFLGQENSPFFRVKNFDRYRKKKPEIFYQRRVKSNPRIRIQRNLKLKKPELKFHNLTPQRIKKPSYSQSIKNLSDLHNYFLPVHKKIPDLFERISSNKRIRLDQYRTSIKSNIPVSSEKDALLQCIVHSNQFSHTLANFENLANFKKSGYAHFNIKGHKSNQLPPTQKNQRFYKIMKQSIIHQKQLTARTIRESQKYEEKKKVKNKYNRSKGVKNYLFKQRQRQKISGKNHGPNFGDSKLLFLKKENEKLKELKTKQIKLMLRLYNKQKRVITDSFMFSLKGQEAK